MKDQNRLITFYPSKGLGDILFTHREEDIVKALGEADEKDIETYIEGSEYDVSLSYYDLGLDFFLEYINGDYSLTIHTDDVILDGQSIAELEKEEALKYIEEYHPKHNLELVHRHAFDEEVEEDCYFFDNLGLTIWYEGETLSDISLQDPDSI